MIKLDESYELKTCPFCAGDNLFLVSKDFSTDRSPEMCRGAIYCESCHITGPVYTSGSLEMLCEDAARVWNIRGKNE